MASTGRRWGVFGAAILMVGAGLLVNVRARAADEAKAPSPDRVAAVKHIMSGVHGPHCGALGELLKGEGPQDDKAWSQMALHAALLNESGHLLMQNNRCPDGVWADATAALRKGTAGLFEAAGRKDVQAAQASFKEVTTSCQTCHAAHKGKPAAAAPVADVAVSPATAPAPSLASPSQPRVASVRHLMSGINAPNCNGLGDALRNDGPKDEKAWQEVVRYAALLNEVGFLLTDNNRCPDEAWMKAAMGLRENSAKVAQAGGAKNLNDARDGFKGVTASCAACHQVHKKPAS